MEPEDEQFLTRVVAAVEKALIDEGYAAQSVIVLAEVITPDMENEVLVATSDGLRAWQSLGLLEYAKTVENGGIMREDE